MNWSDYSDKMVSIRRDLHRYPESGWTEFRTTSLIADRLESLGYDLRVGIEVIEVSAVMGRPDNIDAFIERAIEQGADKKWLNRMCGYTGVVATLETGRPGPVTAFRFDIDCVDTQEAADEKHKPAVEGFGSVNDGCMHACGHDGHTSIGLVFAEHLTTIKEKLSGTIKLIFQPAEEGVRGSYAMTQKGVLDDVDTFCAMHLGLGIPTGTVMAGTHGFLCTTKFDVHYKGFGAHAGGEPEKGHNALLAAATAALNLHAIAPHHDGLTRLNVGVLQAGEGRNVIAPRAMMKVETRGETNKIADYMYGRAERVVKSAADMYEVTCEIKKMGEAVTSTSDSEAISLVSKAASRVEEVLELKDDVAMSGSDDATWMMNRVQENGGVATYVAIGSDIAAGHHNDYFDFDESSMLIALKLFAEVVLISNSVR